MSEPFIAEIRIVGFNFAPRGWAFCDGQLLPIAQNTALFSLVGTTYGGDGRTTFGLPNLQDRVPIHAGNGPGLTDRRIGQFGGTETVTLSEAQIPSHNHALQGTVAPAPLNAPAPDRIVARSVSGYAYQTTDDGAGNLSSQAVTSTGGSQAHTNMQPYLVLNFCIALQGIYPSRS